MESGEISSGIRSNPDLREYPSSGTVTLRKWFCCNTHVDSRQEIRFKEAAKWLLIISLICKY